MRFRWSSAAAALLVLGAVAGAEEPREKPAKPDVVTEVIWTAMLKQADDPKLPPAERLARLQKCAANRIVEVTGKIEKISMDVDGVNPTSVQACGVHGGPQIRSFVVGELDVEFVKEWKRWDRLTWKTRPVVSASGEVTLQPASSMLSDVVRRANPGFEPVLSEKKTDDYRGYAKWILPFVRASYEGRPEEAEACWKAGCAKTWIFPAVVTEMQTGVYTIRLKQDGYLDVLKERRPKDGIDWHVQDVEKRYGFGPTDDLTINPDDQQALALLLVGTAIDVAIDLDSKGFSNAHKKGRFAAAVRLWKIKGKK